MPSEKKKLKINYIASLNQYRSSFSLSLVDFPRISSTFLVTAHHFFNKENNEQQWRRESACQLFHVHHPY